MRRKLAAAKELRRGLRQLGKSDAVFSSSASIDEQRDVAPSLDDFDARLKKASEERAEGTDRA